MIRMVTGLALLLCPKSGDGLMTINLHMMKGKQLVGQNQGVTSIDIAELGLKDFKKYARKYGVDYAVVKDTSTTPTKYSIFFKARDADAIAGLMREYTAKRMKIKKQSRPSILAKLQNFKEIVAKMPGRAREKRKEQER